MADSKMSDLFMYITDQDGNDMKGESSLLVASNDYLMTDFKSADYDTYSNFFDVTDFDFSLELDDSDKAGASDSIGPHADWYMHKDPLKSFADERSRGQIQYKLKKISGSFGKVVDSVSPVFFQNCCRKQSFRRAVLVKRAFTGSKVAAGDSSALAYLQLLMTNVRITGVSWSDGDVVEEKIKFKCDHMEVNYRKQMNPGNLDGPIQLLKWTWATGGKNP